MQSPSVSRGRCIWRPHNSWLAVLAQKSKPPREHRKFSAQQSYRRQHALASVRLGSLLSFRVRSRASLEFELVALRHRLTRCAVGNCVARIQARSELMRRGRVARERRALRSPNIVNRGLHRQTDFTTGWNIEQGQVHNRAQPTSADLDQLRSMRSNWHGRLWPCRERSEDRLEKTSSQTPLNTTSGSVAAASLGHR